MPEIDAWCVCVRAFVEKFGLVWRKNLWTPKSFSTWLLWTRRLRGQSYNSPESRYSPMSREDKLAFRASCKAQPTYTSNTTWESAWLCKRCEEWHYGQHSCQERPCSWQYSLYTASQAWQVFVQRKFRKQTSELQEADHRGIFNATMLQIIKPYHTQLLPEDGVKF